MGIVRTVQMSKGLHRTVCGRALHRFIGAFMLGPRVLRAYHEDSIEDQACFLPFIYTAPWRTSSALYQNIP